MSQHKRIILHCDVNSAYLSWEAVYRLQHGDSVDLRTIPSVIGGDEASRHGIVLAKSIPAKAFGVQTGESLYAVRQRCPHIIVVPPRFDLYMASHDALIEFLSKYFPVIQVSSIDECFAEFTGMDRMLGDPVKIAYEIKDGIREDLGFTVNIGISSNKLLAKMGNDLEKPNKVHTLFPEEIEKKMWPLPVEDLYMVGKATAPKLHQLGIYTIGELAQADVELLKYKFKSFGQILHDFANGIEDSPVINGGRPPNKGIGKSTTISFDVDNRNEAFKVLLSLTETVCMGLRQAGFCARLVAISIRTNEFSNSSRQHKFYTPTDCTTTIYQAACKLFDELWKGQPIRHLGVRVSELCGNDFVQLSLIDETYNERKRKLDMTELTPI